MNKVAKFKTGDLLYVEPHDCLGEVIRVEWKEKRKLTDSLLLPEGFTYWVKLAGKDLRPQGFSDKCLKPLKKPILEKKVWSDKKPRGYHTVKVWNNEKEKGKYSFSIAYGAGVMSRCDRYPGEISPFGQFKTPEEALLSAKLVISQ